MPKVVLACFAVVALSVSACGDPSQKVDDTTQATEIPPPPVVVDDEPIGLDTYSYDPRDRRDPWESYLARAKGESSPELSVLERFPLDELRLVGVLLNATPVALIETPDGEGHAVRIGARVGTHRGEVRAILPGGVVLEERLRDGLGRLLRRDRRLELRPRT